MTKRWIIGMVLGLALFPSRFSDVRGAALVMNGSFESGPPRQPNSPVGFVPLTTGATTITNWLVIGQGIDYIDTFWQHADGLHSLDLNSLEPSGLQQTIATVVGQQYRVTFDMAGNYEGSPAVKTLTVSAGGQSQAYSFNTAGKSAANMGWLPKSFDFTATSANTVLTFQATSPGGFGPALDNVAISEIPEPGGMVAVGVLGMAAARARHSRRLSA